MKRRQRLRSVSANATALRNRQTSVQMERKENIIFENELLKPGSSKMPKRKSNMKIHKTILKKNKTKLTLSLKCKNLNAEKGKVKTSPLLVPILDGGNQALSETKKTEVDLSKFQPGKSFVEKTMFSWDVTATTSHNETMYEDKNFSKNPSEASCSPQPTSKMNAFSKNSFFNKSKKLTLRRIGSNVDNSVKTEKMKKKKRLVKKH